MTSKEIRNEIITNRAEIRMLQRTNQGIDARWYLIARNHELMQVSIHAPIRVRH